MIQEIVLSPDGSKMASRSGSGVTSEIKLWSRNYRSGGFSGPTNLPIPLFGGQGIKFDSESNFLIINNSYDGMKVWNINNNEIFSPPLDHIGNIRKSIVTAGGEKIISAGEDNTIRIWDGKEEPLILRGHRSTVSDIVLHPDNQTLISAGADNSIRIWTIEDDSAKEVNQFEISEELGEDFNASPRLQFSKDGSLFICWFILETRSNGGKRFNYVVDIFKKDGEKIDTLKWNHTTGHAALVSFNRLGIIGFIDRKDDIDIVDPTGKVVSSMRGHVDWVNSLDVNVEAQELVSASNNGTIKTWNFDGALLQEFKAHKKSINSVIFSPNGHQIVSASDDKKIRIWSKDGEVLHEILDHTAAVVGLSFSPDNKTLASSGLDNTIHFWDAETYEPKGMSLKTGGPPSFDSLSFNAKGNILSEGSSIDNLQIYFTGRQSFWLKKATLSPVNTIEDLALNGDRPLETIAVDDGLEIVALGLDALMEKACNRVRGYLKNSSRVDEKDRDLCDGIGDEEVE